MAADTTDGTGQKKRRARGSNGNGGYTKRKNGSWEYRKFADDGRRVSGYGKDQATARENCERKIRLQSLGVDTEQARQPLGAYLEAWMSNPDLQPNTVESYRWAARHILPALGATQIGKLSASRVQALLRDKQKPKAAGGAGLSPRSVGMLREVLHAAMQDAMKLGMVERNVVALVDAPRRERQERHPFTQEEALAFLDAADRDRLAAAYRVTLMYGLRLGETLGLRWQDVDFDAGIIYIRGNLQRVRLDLIRPEHVAVTRQRKHGQSILVLKTPKTASSRRRLAMTESVAAALRTHRDRQVFERQAAGARWLDTGLVFTTTDGSGIDPETMRKLWLGLLDGAGLRRQRFHDLRHAAATLMLQDNVSPTDVAATLGHARVSTTLNVYAHVLDGAPARTASAMERLLERRA